MLADGNAYKLLEILQSYAPDRCAQQQCAELVQEMEADGLSENEMVSRLAGALLDGLTYGNWLWDMPWHGVKDAAARAAIADARRDLAQVLGRVSW